MIIKITEQCYLNEIDTETGIRTIVYESNKNELQDAIDDFNEHFDSDNIIESHDDFDDECLWSQVIEVCEVK